MAGGLERVAHVRLKSEPARTNADGSDAVTVTSSGPSGQDKGLRQAREGHVTPTATRVA